MDYAKLREELAKDAYLKLSDKEAADLLNTPTVRVPKPSTMIGERKIFDLLGTVAGEVFMQTVEGLAASPPTESRVVFKRVDRWLKDSVGLDIGSAEVQGVLLLLSQGEQAVFDPESVEKLIEHGSQYVSRAAQLGIGLVGDGHVEWARSSK